MRTSKAGTAEPTLPFPHSSGVEASRHSHPVIIPSREYVEPRPVAQGYHESSHDFTSRTAVSCSGVQRCAPVNIGCM